MAQGCLAVRPGPEQETAAEAAAIQLQKVTKLLDGEMGLQETMMMSKGPICKSKPTWNKGSLQTY